MLIRRTRPTPLTHAGFAKPVFKGYTDANGNRTADAPKPWPFGRVKPRVLSATRRTQRPVRGPEIEDNEEL